MTKKTGFFVSIICLLVGIILGIFISPVKHGICNYSVNTTCCGKKHEKERL
jgi:hypothetical protein